jgi:LacI family transcriptional regulator
MPATIKDVARLADCSIKTVSRVINNEAHVKESMRVRVQTAIRATGYSPNLSARRLVQQKSYAVCILTYPGFMQPASALLTRLLDLTYEENYDLFLQTYYPPFPRSRRKFSDFVSGRRFDGYISTPPCEADGFIVSLLETYKIPIVQINPLIWELEERENRLIVASEDMLGANMAVSHLLNLGHRRIAFLRGPKNFRASRHRFTGFNSALNEAGLEVNPDYLQDSEFTFDGGYTAAQILMRLPDPPTAIYAASDESAQGVLFAAQEAGVNVPGELSICGHDDLLSSARTWPGLTTIHQPIEDLLEQALKLLFNKLKGSEISTDPVILSPRLVLRGSTDKPNRKQ